MLRGETTAASPYHYARLAVVAYDMPPRKTPPPVIFPPPPRHPFHPNSQTSPLLTPITLDQNDESLRKWKESLGLGSGNTISDPNDPRKVILLSLGLEVEGRPDIVIDLTQKGALDTLIKKPFTIKEGATFRMKARFRVQHEILSGMKYVQVVSRMGAKTKMQEMIVRLFFSLHYLSPSRLSLFRGWWFVY